MHASVCRLVVVTLGVGRIVSKKAFDEDIGGLWLVHLVRTPCLFVLISTFCFVDEYFACKGWYCL